MDEPDRNEKQQEGQVVRKAWNPMELTFRGHLADVVRGGGKQGSRADADPQSTFKRGVG